MSRRAWAYALALNVLVSAGTTLLVLWWWDRHHPLPPVPEGAAWAAGTPAPPGPSGFAYVVAEGETLADIARRFGVDIQSLRAVNHLVTDQVQPGQVLIIPGVTPPTARGDPAGVQVVAVLGAGVLADEHVRLQYRGSDPIDLRGWTLEDEDGHRFTFPALVLYPQGAVNIWTKPGRDTVVHLYWGLTQAIWQPGETLTLRDAQGQVVTTYTVAGPVPTADLTPNP